MYFQTRPHSLSWHQLVKRWRLYRSQLFPLTKAFLRFLCFLNAAKPFYLHEISFRVFFAYCLACTWMERSLTRWFNGTTAFQIYAISKIRTQKPFLTKIICTRPINQMTWCYLTQTNFSAFAIRNKEQESKQIFCFTLILLKENIFPSTMGHKFSKDSIEFQFGELASLFYQFELFNVYMLWLDHSMSAVSVFQLHILKCNRVRNGFFSLVIPFASHDESMNKRRDWNE